MQKEVGKSNELIIDVITEDKGTDNVIVEMPNSYHAWATRAQADAMIASGEAIAVHEASELEVRAIYKDRDLKDQWMSRNQADKLLKAGSLDAIVEA
jgi:hypothetical protein